MTWINKRKPDRRSVNVFGVIASTTPDQVTGECCTDEWLACIPKRSPVRTPIFHPTRR